MASRKRHLILLVSEKFLKTVPGAHLTAASMYDQHLALKRRKRLHTVTFFDTPAPRSSTKRITAVLHEERDGMLLHRLDELPKKKIIELQQRHQSELAAVQPTRKRTPRR